jgi:hypothetical protein
MESNLNTDVALEDIDEKLCELVESFFPKAIAQGNTDPLVPWYNRVEEIMDHVSALVRDLRVARA